MASFAMPFFLNVYAYYARLLIRNTVGVQGVFEECLVWPMIFQPILHRKPVRGDLLLCNRW